MIDVDLPDGLSLADFTSHPVRTLLRDPAYFGPRAVPTAADVEALQLPADQQTALAEACERVAQVQATGHHQEAWRTADQVAAKIIGALPEAQRRPDYLTPLEDLDGLSPDELAAKVPRGS